MTDVHSSVGGYVLHALDPAEVAEFEAHLATCEECSQEVLEFSATAAELAQLTEAAPPPALRRSVLTAIRGVAQLPPEAPVEDAQPRHAVSSWADDHLEPEQHLEPDPPGEPVQPTSVDDDAAEPGRSPVAEPAPVTRLEDARRRRRSRVWIAVAAAVAVIAIGAGGWAVNLQQRLNQQQADATAQAQQAAQQQAQADREAAILRAPDAKIYAQSTSDGRLSYVVSKRLNAGVVLTDDLARTATGKTYQLWTVRISSSGKTDFVPDVTFAGGAGQRIFFTTDLAKAGAVGLTVEPTGGSPQPTGTPFAVAEL